MGGVLGKEGVGEQDTEGGQRNRDQMDDQEFLGAERDERGGVDRIGVSRLFDHPVTFNEGRLDLSVLGDATTARVGVAHQAAWSG
jgi:hypothetical protein